ncbi:hypothetical protein N7476_008062 [Penicillium atrosanguineum]|uniref:C2H2-type domain-containing protein n=1 Tax=Penicillium atrosanguineum TaxID=1132637 RepID=A0A9W9PR02_9EURO|nr:hypothetical protein N7476_008062 [Penicillium atrosanguineum]
MSSGRTSIVSILNNDDHPSFAVRSNPRLSRNQASFYPSDQQLAPSVSDSQYARPHASSVSPMASPQSTRHPLEPVTETVQPTSPGSSEGSVYDYLTNQSTSGYHPYARQDHQYNSRYPSRGPAAPRTPPRFLPAAKKRNRSREVPGVPDERTSHAARHGKKHTGEKSVHCPICNKAFTRKDNMKQHIRTHRTHSDDMRSTSEPETDGRWAMSRGDSNYASTTHSRTVSQSTDASVMPPPGSGPHHPS